jgi:hypothetical protein
MGLVFQKRYSRHQSLQGKLKIHHFWFLIVIYQINSEFILLTDQIQFINLAYGLLSLFYQLHLKNVFHANHFHLNLHCFIFIVKVDLLSILFFQELSRKIPDFVCHLTYSFPQFQKLIVNLLLWTINLLIMTYLIVDLKVFIHLYLARLIKESMN